MKKVVEFLKELKKKPYGKAVFFFGFYLIFFIVLAILVRLGGHVNIDTNNVLNNKTSIVDMNSLTNNDYSYKYEVKIDNNTYTYTGTKKNNRFDYKYNDKDYYQENLITYVKESEWVSIESPIKYNMFLDESFIGNIIDSSYSESKTTYESGDITYNLLITSDTLNKLINKKNTDTAGEPNRISVSINSYKYVNEITYNLDNYCKLNNICTSNLNIKVKYDNFYSVN